MSLDHDQEFSLPSEKQPPFAPSELQPTSKLSVLSLVSGITGITIFPLLGSLVAIVTGHAALSELRESSGRLGGRATAKAGLWLGYVPVVLVLIGAMILGMMFIRFGPQGLNDLNYGRMPATRTESSAARGVKMVNEMSRDDFKERGVNNFPISNR
jgi:hypothetical protein